MRRLLLLLWLGSFGLLHAVSIITDLPETVMPFAGQEPDTDNGRANGVDATEFSLFDTAPKARRLYTTVVSKPERLFEGEIFSVTLRSIVTTDLFESLQYHFSGGIGVELLSETPERELRDHAYYDRFYFKATDGMAMLPDITPSLTVEYEGEEFSDTIPGTKIDVTVLNPPKNFCGILADRFSISHAKTTVYDKGHNIIVFMADANRSDLGMFHIPSADKQDFESLQTLPHASSMSYFAVLPNTIETLNLQYFNLKTQRYDQINIPINVEDDLVSTMSDLRPVEHSHQAQKTYVFLALALLFLGLALWKRSWTLLVITVLAGGYAAWLNIPLRKVCIEKGAPIYLLPMRNATVFEIAPRRYILERQGHVKDYTKVRLLNDKIGWVEDENICAH